MCAALFPHEKENRESPKNDWIRNAPPPPQHAVKRIMLCAQWPEWMEVWDLQVHDDCSCNEQRAIMGRVLDPTPPYHPELDEYLDTASVKIQQQLRSHGLRLMYGEELLMSFPKQRRKKYRNAQEGVVKVTDAQAARISTFVKTERMLIISKDPDPRVIQARSAEFNVQVASMTKPVEHAVYILERPLAELHPCLSLRVIAKGMNSLMKAYSLRTMWETLHQPVALALDVSRWDKHLKRKVLKKELKVYRNAMPCTRIDELMQMTLDNKCQSVHGWNYKAESRMSGDMTTALGNCLVALMLVTAFKDYARRRIGHFVALELLDGDDLCLMVEAEVAPIITPLIVEFYHLAGFKLRVDGTATEFEQVEFCQHRPVDMGTHWKMLPNPRKVLATAGFTGARHPKPREYFREIWAARHVLHKGEPVLGAIFKPWRRWVDLEKLFKMSPSLYYQIRRTGFGVDQPNPEPALETRLSYMRAWGLSLEEQSMFESMNLVLPPRWLSMFIFGLPLVSYQRECRSGTISIEKRSEWPLGIAK